MRSALRDPEVVYRRRWLTLLVLCISLIVITLDNTILNVALPTLARPEAQGGSGGHRQPAAVDRRLLHARVRRPAAHRRAASATASAATGCLAIGLALFGLGSAASAFATSADMLIVTRALMGVGGACIMPSTLSIITNVFTDPAERGKAIGVWAGVSALGHRARPDHRRLPARALLVGLGLHRERARS